MIRSWACACRQPVTTTKHCNALTWQLHTYGTQADRPDLPDWIEDPQDFGSDEHRRLRPDRLYLVRPDGFIAASLPLHAKSVDRTQLRAALAAHDIKD